LARVKLKGNFVGFWNLSAVNASDRADFVRALGGVFEHSPWVAERVVDQRPFASVGALHEAMREAVRNAAPEEQLAIIRAHPDLVGRAVLTAESQGEQAAAGLTDLSREDAALFDRYNREYKARFGFPFVICARLNKKDAILRAFPVRLQNDAEAERATALEEIYKIAHLRLADLISE
jgi:2-oxo-4-hydroxy-4-carboxy-5-ureidoimidazoline decarboxylase